MILGSLVRRAETALEAMLDQALVRVAIALPFLIAGAFATAAASTYLNARYGAQMGHLAMAGIFLGAGLMGAATLAMRARPRANAQDAADQSPPIAAGLAGGHGASTFGASTTGASTHGASTAGHTADQTEAAAFSQSERELLQALFASAAPLAVPGVVRLLLRNIPLLLAGLVLVFVLTRSPAEGQSRAAAP